jgi:DNA modification methylase
MGSGVVGKIAKKMNRNFIGFEKDVAFFEAAEKNIKKT